MLTWRPDAARLRIELRQATASAATAYRTIKDAATAYLEAQVQLVVSAHSARDGGLAVTELDTSWLTITPEEAVIEARVDSLDAETRSEHLNGEVGKIMAALLSNGYEPHLRVEDIRVEGGGKPAAWTPGDARA